MQHTTATGNTNMEPAGKQIENFLNPSAKTAGIYLHVPFCKQACVYCNFHFSTSLRSKGDVVQAMMLELEMQREYLQGATIETIYFGGGTPSLLSADELNRIFDTIYSNFPSLQIKECTLEANPDDLDKKYLQALHNTPVNRLSIGVQSFRDEGLQYMKRAHTAQQADYVIKSAQDTGFTNLSIDLIYGTPGLTDNAWKHNLDQVKQNSIPHFSAYALTVEEKTALHHNIQHKKAMPVDPEQAAGQAGILMERALAMGYEHYEISNLALPGQYAVHNTNYWRGNSYLGIGPSAHSFNGVARRWNVANNALYAGSMLKDRKLMFEEEVLTTAQQINEYIMTSLRTQWGCDLSHISKRWGSEYVALVVQDSHQFQEKRWVKQDGGTLTLTPQGRLFADRIAGALFVDL